MATKQRCPKCNHLNDLDAKQCEHCSTPFVQVCPICGTERPWYVRRCPNCRSQNADASSFANLFRKDPDRHLHDRYILQERISSGQVSAVYQAIDSKDPTRRYAIKQLSTVALLRARERELAETNLRNTIKRWSQVDHPALLPIADLFKEQDAYYVVSDLAGGRTMQQIINDRHLNVPPKLARNWGAQLSNLLIHLHEQKPPLHVPFLAPEHVMVTDAGGVKILGFGLSRFFIPNTQRPYGSVRGYMAPELGQGEAPSVKTDIFALGRLLYALLIGRLLERGLSRRFPLQKTVPGISKDLVRIIARAAHRNPTSRFSDASEFEKALWPPQRGPLTPLPNWAELATVAPLPASKRQESTRTQQTMADLGFEPDVRFRPREQRPESEQERPRPAPIQEKRRPALSIHPHRFDLGEVKPAGKERLALQMHNTGNAELHGRVISNVDWLKAPKKPIRLPAEKRAKVMLSLQTDMLPTGKMTEPQALSVETNAGNQQIAFAARIVRDPLLHVRETTLDFGQVREITERVLTIENAGGNTLTGRVISQAPWLQVPQKSFRCSQDTAVQVTVEILPQQMPPGPQVQEQALIVDSDAGQASIEVQAEHAVPKLILQTEQIDFGHLERGESKERSLSIGNEGNAHLRGQIQTSSPWLQARPEAFGCPPDDTIEITLTMDSTDLSDGLIHVPQAVRVETNGGTETLTLQAHVHAPEIVLDTRELAFGALFAGEKKHLHLRLHNDGSAPLSAHIESKVRWLALSQDEIRCDPGEGVSIRVTADGTHFAKGQKLSISDAIVISSAPDIQETVAASVQVLKPSLHIEPTRVNFGYIDPDQPETRTLLIKNGGTGDLAWTAQKDAVWLEVSPTTGTCPAGETQEIELTAYGLALDSDVEEEIGTLIINSDGGRAKVPLRAAPSSPLISTDVTFLDLGTSVNREDVQRSLRIFNHGLGTLRGSINTDKTWLVVDRVSFECAMGRSIEIDVGTDMEEFPTGDDKGTGTISIQSNGGYTEVQVEIELQQRPHLEVPETIPLKRRSEDSSPQARFPIRNSGLATARVHLQSDAPEVILERKDYDIKPDKSVPIRITWQGPPPEGERRPRLHIETENQEFDIPIVLDDKNSMTLFRHRFTV
ncbi:MAG: BACON domain-containing protein [Anaerolineales bacterium]